MWGVYAVGGAMSLLRREIAPRYHPFPLHPRRKDCPEGLLLPGSVCVLLLEAWPTPRASSPSCHLLNKRIVGDAFEKKKGGGWISIIVYYCFNNQDELTGGLELAEGFIVQLICNNAGSVSAWIQMV